jgi:hypothetical protein
MKKHLYMACSVAAVAIGTASVVTAFEGGYAVGWKSVTAILLGLVGIAGAALRGRIAKQPA